MADNCCFLCKSQFGCVNHSCTHHVEARRNEDADDNARRTVRRPTEDQAIRNVMRARNPKRRARARVYPKEET